MNEILQKRIEAESNKYMEEAIEMNSVVGDNLHYEDLKTCFIEAADFALQNQWISVEEALPILDEKYDFSERYIVRTQNNEVKVMRIFRNIAWCDIYNAGAYISFEKKIVTHWMPIPSLEGGEK